MTDQQNTEVSEASKTRAIITHLTLIGWVIGFVQNSDDKDEFTSFYIRQMLGLMIIAIAGAIIGAIIPIVGWIIQLGALVLWILSLMGAINGKKELTPVAGPMFQDWFKAM